MALLPLDRGVLASPSLPKISGLLLDKTYNEASCEELPARIM